MRSHRWIQIWRVCRPVKDIKSSQAVGRAWHCLSGILCGCTLQQAPEFDRYGTRPNRLVRNILWVTVIPVTPPQTEMRFIHEHNPLPFDGPGTMTPRQESSPVLSGQRYPCT
ncbi:hypothetical protein TNCV_2497551 [Trichonephila clavipes]|nr:hypothetical protein TNCV_2497551 [Trichonephila clavipes]